MAWVYGLTRRPPQLRKWDMDQRVRPRTKPIVSLILTVKNGMPFLVQSINSLREQTFQNYELVVQDCLSNDGGFEYLKTIDWCDISLVSEQDGGIGDAWHKAIGRAKGEIIGSIDCDNILLPKAIESAITAFRENPKAAVVYAGCEMINTDGSHNSSWMPQEFDFLKLISCDLVPPWSTAFFNRAHCEQHLKFDPSLKTCVDYDVWLHMSLLNIQRISEYWGATRLSEKSMTCRPEGYEQFCKDKTFALRRFLHKSFQPAVAQSLFKFGAAGIYRWAASSLSGMGADRAMIEDYENRAAGYWVISEAERQPIDKSDTAGSFSSLKLDMVNRLHRTIKKWL